MRHRFLPLVAAIALMPATALAQAPATQPTPREIVVDGTGEARAAPDLATATFAVVRNAKTAREALDQANTAMREVIDGMRALGVESRDLQTSGFGIQPQYRYDNDNDGEQRPPELVGYEVRNGLTVRIRDVGKAGEVLDRAVSLGVNSGGDISFGMDDPAKLRTQARQDAVRDATANASALAEAAGVKLGPVVRMVASESGAFPPPPPMPMGRMKMAAEAAPAAPVEAGETAVQANVSMTFSIAPN